jgi:hypothetical protein
MPATGPVTFQTTKARPSTPGSGSIVLLVAPVHAPVAGVIRTVDPIGEKTKFVVPATL